MKTRFKLTLAALMLAASTAFAQQPATPPDEDDSMEDVMAFDDEVGAMPMPPDDGGGMHGGPGMHGMRMRGGEGGGHGMRRARMAELDLTDDQRDKLADIHDRAKRRAVPIRSNLEIAQLDLRKLLRADKPAKSTVDAQIDKIAKLRGDLSKSRMQAMLEAREVFTPEQRAKMHGRGMGH